MRLTRSRKPSPPAQGPVCKVQWGWCGVALQSASAGLGPWGLLGGGCGTGPVVAGFRAAARGGATRALAAGCAGSSECGAWATAWRHPGRPRFADCQRLHGLGLVHLGAATLHAQRLQRQAPPHAEKGWADLQQKNAWPSSLAGRTEYTDAEICREAPSGHAGDAPARGAWPVQTAQMQRSGKTRESPAPTWPIWAHGVQEGLGETGPGLAQGNSRPGSGRQEAWQAAAVTACWVSLQQLALSTLGLRK